MVVSNTFNIFTPIFGEDVQFDDIICFRWVGEKPATRNDINLLDLSPNQIGASEGDLVRELGNPQLPGVQFQDINIDLRMSRNRYLLSGCQTDGSWGAIKQPLGFEHNPLEGAGNKYIYIYIFT